MRAMPLLIVCRPPLFESLPIRFREQQKKKRFYVFVKSLRGCVGVRWQETLPRSFQQSAGLLKSRDAKRPDELFGSLPSASGNNKKEEVLHFCRTSSLVRWKGLEPPAF